MRFDRLKRREFITLLGGVAAWPLAAHAQPERMRRIGVLITTEQNDRENQAQLEVFRQALRELGWREGGNVRIDMVPGPNGARAGSLSPRTRSHGCSNRTMSLHPSWAGSRDAGFGRCRPSTDLTRAYPEFFGLPASSPVTL